MLTFFCNFFFETLTRPIKSFSFSLGRKKHLFAQGVDCQQTRLLQKTTRENARLVKVRLIGEEDPERKGKKLGLEREVRREKGKSKGGSEQKAEEETSKKEAKPEWEAEEEIGREEARP